MMDFLIYQSKVAFCLLLFYSIWKFFLQRETFHKINRIYLISTLILAFIIPLIKPVFNFSANQQIFSIILKPFIVESNKSREILNSIHLVDITVIIYIIISTFLLLNFFRKMIIIINLLNKSNKKQLNNFNVCYTDKPISPFSFLSFVFINTNNLELNQIDKILLHESVHVKQKHSFDLILLELISILQWFNPIIYLYKHSVKTIHEYLSDEKVLAQGYDSDDYKLLLLQQKIGIQPGFVSNLNKSLTLKRIIMMNQKKSKNVAKFKVLLLVPAILLSVILFSCQKENIQSPKAPTQNSFSDEANLPSPPPPPSSSIDKMPEFPGGEAALSAFLQKNVVYPPEAIKNNYQGTIFVRFLVDKEGKVKDPKIIRGGNEILNKEALRVIGLLPKFKPATKDGSPAEVYFTLPITFSLNN